MKFVNRYNSPSPTKPKWERTPDGFLRCRARILAERILPYNRSEFQEVPEDAPEVIQMLVSREAMSSAESLRSLEGAPVVIGEHQWLSPEVIKEYGVGHVAGTPVIDGPYLVCDLLITDPDAIESIESGENDEISAGYTADTIFTPGDWEGDTFHARQARLRYNHIAVIPAGTGRCGNDVRIINKKEDVPMADANKVRVRLRNTKRILNVDEEAAAAISEEEQVSGEKLQESMSALEEKTGEMEALQAEIEDLKGQLSVYKQKLDELLSTEAIEAAAGEMVAEQGDAEEIMENAIAEEEDKEKKEEIMNSIKGVYGTKLHSVVLAHCGVRVENMSPEGLRGAFKAQAQIAKARGGRHVAGAKMMNQTAPNTASVTVTQPGAGRSAMERLGFKPKA